MGLRFYFGPSGAGKSRQLYEEIIERSMVNPKQNFLVIVPDQFTMQTQMELVTLHRRGGIMNIDVLSFGRLSHRIFEEVGRKNIPVLDDTGKSLVIQKVAASIKDDIPVLGSHLSKQGYIHEVKSAISEFMQYGMGSRDIEAMVAAVEGRAALSGKLKDLKTLYEAFYSYINEKFVTTEETLDILIKALPRSEILKNSVVIFDGFTGFTPIQNRLIQELMCICSEVTVTLTLGENENPDSDEGLENLFYLSKKTVRDLSRLADKASIKRAEDVFVGEKDRVGKRFVNSKEMDHLEKNIFRTTVSPYRGVQEAVQIFETTDPAMEVHQTATYIMDLIREKGYAYRDIAVICGNLEAYAPYVEREFAEMGIPCYVDRTRGIVLNPFIESIKSAMDMFLRDFSYDSVFHYLRSGMTDISAEDVDLLENYIIRTGIRGYKKYSRLFTHRTDEMADESELSHINNIRERLLGEVEHLKLAGRGLTKDYVNGLYDFLVENRTQEKLVFFSEHFKEVNELERAKEYEQIYRLVMQLLEQIYELLGDEEIEYKEFYDILEAGFGEIKVGTIPQKVDRILVGDIERTRLKQVKALFFIGVNDGFIPKKASKGGIISDMDREFLAESGFELAPTPRQQMFIQKFYLYLNMTKPSERLFLSYSRMGADGKSIRPSYLIGCVKEIFPDIQIQYPEYRNIFRQIYTKRGGARYLAQGLREYAEGLMGEESKTELYTLYEAYNESDEQRRYGEAAFERYKNSALSKAVAKAIYGANLQNSVSRLEKFASCEYMHFLTYGLKLKERKEFGFEKVDMGNVYHYVLETFANSLEENGYTWFDFPEEYGRRAVAHIVEKYAASYGDTILYSNERNRYAITRMSRILTRTVMTLKDQIRKGSFKPSGYEISFRYTDSLKSTDIMLSDEERMHLSGKIDRLDIAEDDSHVYVKIIDYKSGKKDFDLAALYYGTQLQLVVYMNVALEKQQMLHPHKEVVPAALLYYGISDPLVKADKPMTDQEISEAIVDELKQSGLINSDEYVIEKLDGVFENKSSVVNVTRNKDGSIKSNSSMMNASELRLLSDYATAKIKAMGKDIMAGNISKNPYEDGDRSACAYCDYRSACGFDKSIPGTRTRSLDRYSKEEIFEKMEEFIKEQTDGS